MTDNYFTCAINPDLKKKFKSVCALNGVNMTDIVIGYISEYVNEKNIRRGA